MKTLALILFGLLALPRPGAAESLLKDGDRVVFFGDSITEFGNYSSPLEAWLTLRHPAWKLSFFNAGWAGDNTEGGLYRLERDVLSLKPTLVLMCFGMNDAYYMNREEWVGKLYEEHLKSISDRLKAAGVRLVLLTPGIVDEEGEKNAWLKDIHYNDGGLSMMVEHLKAFAEREKLPWVDLHSLMAQVNAKARAADPKFNMLPDAIHPDEAGGLIMSYAFLQALGEDKVDAKATLNAAAGTAEGKGGLSLEKLAREPDGSYSATLRFESLPYFVEPKSRAVLPYLPWQEDYNRYSLGVEGLSEPASVELGGEPTAFLSPEALAAGLRLERAWGSGPLRKSALVIEFAREKQKSFIQLWRNLALRPNYNVYEEMRPLPFRLAVENNEKLQDLERELAQAPADGVPLRLIPLPRQGEAAGNGDWIRTFDLSPAFKNGESLNVTASSAADLSGTAGLWTPRRLNVQDPDNNLGFLMDPPGKAEAYALALVTSPIAQRAALKLGKDDSVEVWLNGKSAYQSKKGGSLKADSDTAPLALKKGANLLLIKVGQGGGAWGLLARFDGLKQPVRTWAPSLVPAKGGKP